jgi:hypothetical protein
MIKYTPLGNYPIEKEIFFYSDSEPTRYLLD